ncbi:sensor domain CHASE3-containing protein [Marinospirillum celere]|uniref:Sensor domain CHASE3-containing protein n=1 Tax=Marinospirillum celere TaxID=1122252 RepID=A0A1I1J6B8_9GAMM|nr:hypothetical protein [Marinospirillum celere]SFC44117.1 sensor domain CHASE3-containing protein [Marinospirillum celere]
MKLQTKLLLSLTMIILINALVAAVVMLQVSGIREEAEELSSNEIPLMAAMGEASAAVSYELLAMREYRYSQNPVYLDAFNQAHERWLTNVPTIRSLLAQSEIAHYSEQLEQAIEAESALLHLFQELVDVNALYQDAGDRFGVAEDRVDAFIAAGLERTLGQAMDQAMSEASALVRQRTLEQAMA